MKFHVKCKRNHFVFDKKVCVGKTLNLGICSKFQGNFEGIWGSPGEIPHIGWKTLGVYRVNIETHTIYQIKAGYQGYPMMQIISYVVFQKNLLRKEYLKMKIYFLNFYFLNIDISLTIQSYCMKC